MILRTVFGQISVLTIMTSRGNLRGLVLSTDSMLLPGCENPCMYCIYLNKVTAVSSLRWFCRKYLGVEMGHCDFGADQPTETNEESLMRIVNSMDHLLEQNGSIHLKRKAEERIKTANNLTYNSLVHYHNIRNIYVQYRFADVSREALQD